MMESHDEMDGAMADHTDWLARGSRQELAQRRIQGAARALLAERGVENFTAEAVARRAGCSRATLYRVTGGAQALLEAVVQEAGASVVDEVRRQVEGLAGPARAEAAVLAAVTAIRRDHALLAWLVEKRGPRANAFLGSATSISQMAHSLAGLTGADPLAGGWIVRVVLALVTWPAADPEEERLMVERFLRLAPAGAQQPGP